jgi:hypothetical protein
MPLTKKNFTVETRLQDENWEDDSSFPTMQEALARVDYLRNSPLGRSCMFRVRDNTAHYVDTDWGSGQEDDSAEVPTVLALAIQERSEPPASWCERHGFKTCDEKGVTDDWPRALAAWRLACAEELMKRYREETI